MFAPSFLNDAMRHAAAEARKWLGSTSPNPPVGAVALAADGSILDIAAHHRAGGAHAEALLLEQCAQKSLLDQVHTLCVTLEPCNHHGKTPPCSDAIIKAGIKRVVIGARDPNPKVQGGGIERLRNAGIDVLSGIAEQECLQLMHAFAYKMTTGNPWVTVKRAVDANGSMIPPKGQKTFTSQDSLVLAHRLRKKADAIVTGSGTILEDSPLFTIRHIQDHPDRHRWLVIMDRRRRVPDSYLTAAEERGFKVLIHDDLSVAMEDLSNKGTQDILIEAGPTLSQSLLDSGLWTMSVAVQQGGPDSIQTGFNQHAQLPFDPQQFCWDHFLPQE